MAKASVRAESVKLNLKSSNTPIGKASDKAANAILPTSKVVETITGDTIKVQPEIVQPKVKQRITIHSKAYPTGSLRVIQYNLVAGVEYRVSFKKKTATKSASKVENKFLTAEKMTDGSENITEYGRFTSRDEAILCYKQTQAKILYGKHYFAAKRKPLVLKSKAVLGVIDEPIEVKPLAVCNLATTPKKFHVNRR